MLGRANIKGAKRELAPWRGMHMHNRKNYSKRSAFFFVVLIIVTLCVATTAYATTNYILSKKELYTLPNDAVSGYAPGVTGALCIVGADAWIIRNNGTDNRTIFYHVKNYATPDVTQGARMVTLNGNATNAGHANGLAYYKTPNADTTVTGSFYIATMKDIGAGSQVLQINNQGQITKQYKASKVISSIAHYSGNQFIVGIKDTEKSGYRTYYLATKNDTANTYLVRASLLRAMQNILPGKILHTPMKNCLCLYA